MIIRSMFLTKVFFANCNSLSQKSHHLSRTKALSSPQHQNRQEHSDMSSTTDVDNMQACNSLRGRLLIVHCMTSHTCIGLAYAM